MEGTTLSKLRLISTMSLYFATLVTLACKHLPDSNVKATNASSLRLTTEEQLPQLMRHEGAIMELWNQNQDKFLSVNRYYGTDDEQTKINLNYKEFFNPQSRGAIVIVHGFGEYIGKYRELVYDFYSNGYSVYIYNQRGFGRSERILKAKPYRVYADNFAYYVNDLDIFIQRVVKPKNHPKTFLFSHSMGGAIVSLFLKEFPGSIDAAVLSSPMIKALTPPPFTEEQIFAVTTAAIQAGGAAEYLPGQSDPNPALDTIEYSGTSSQVRFDEYKQWRDQQDQDKERPFLTWGSTQGFINTVIANTIELRKPDRAKQITTPILMGVSMVDTFVDVDSAKKFCLSLPNCASIAYQDKHELWFDRDPTRNDFLTKTLEFFQNH